VKPFCKGKWFPKNKRCENGIPEKKRGEGKKKRDRREKEGTAE